LDVITLHREEARHAFFAEAPARPIFFDSTIKAWVVADPSQCEALLVSPHLNVAPFREAYEEMAGRHPDFSFPNLLFAIKYVPLCLNGDEHRAARRQLAEHMARHRGAASAAAPSLVERWIGKLDQGGEFELMAEVIEPLVREFLFALNGADEMPEGFTRDASALFDRMLGLTRRRQVDDTIAVLRAAIRKRLGPDASEEEEGWRLALLILGHDPLAGTLAASLHKIMRAHSTAPLSEIAYPPTPIEPSVAYAERIVAEPFRYRDVGFAKGDRVRILLQSFQYSGEAADRMRMFGAGAHVCLGRQVALELWSLITKRLSQIGSRVEVLDYALCGRDYVFAYPAKFSIAITP
jgi:cytochrome P450